MSKNKDERLQQIRQILEENEQLRTSALAKMLSVTPETIRSDLNILEQQNLVRREHGYVRTVSALSEIPLLVRGKSHADEKKRIAHFAMNEIEDGMVVFLDAGSTVLAGLPYLNRKKDLTIVTNSIPLVYQASMLNMKMILAGGLLMNVGLRTTGPDALEMLRHFVFDVALLGTDGIEGCAGFTTLDYAEVPFKDLIVKRSRKKVVVTDVSKFTQKANYTFCTFKDIDEIITGPLTSNQLDLVKDITHIIQVDMK